MAKYVSGVFKAIMISMVGVIVLGVVMYVSSMYALDSKVKSIKYSMMSNISRNNYLTNDSYKLYQRLLDDVKAKNPNLVESISMNYGVRAVSRSGFTLPTGATTDLSVPANAGDVQVLQIKVVVRRDVWGSSSSSGAVTSASDLEHGWSRGTFYYEELIPCNRYVK